MPPVPPVPSSASPPRDPRAPILVIVHQAHSTCGRVGAVLRARGHILDRRVPLLGDPLPADLSGHAGVVVFGGPMSANDDHRDGIRAELAVLERAMGAGLPVLGICLGAQMMARVAGARVSRHPAERVQIGYYPLWPTAAGRRRGLFDGETPAEVYHWHTEGFDLPPGATLLARGPDFPNQAFALGERALGIQFHPEVTHEMMERWIHKAAPMLMLPGARPAEDHRAGRRRFDAAVARWVERFLDRWLG
ncbi:glutamine amidotransferase-related protein [Roseospira visakhapatnamensis]|uniref:GMP synthase (Glutamine-hydrolyzing) n=1 Tax=Roseospira visakhapatnamensis TaxID=390880 RepID=A0A7W6RA41_9PROT|nr:gamma-glutamyl-gamma-aminobutyrate hydrolase family protein [Roseospira visakhapatnamensis]MBB4264552.1 GMP synthase (glutamine-hydrolyzing) [Roseospira visakhapatnamensis]